MKEGREIVLDKHMTIKNEWGIYFYMLRMSGRKSLYTKLIDKFKIGQHNHKKSVEVSI